MAEKNIELDSVDIAAPLIIKKKMNIRLLEK